MIYGVRWTDSNMAMKQNNGERERDRGKGNERDRGKGRERDREEKGERDREDVL